MGSWRALVVRFAQEFKWPLGDILQLTRPQARLLLQGLRESMQVRSHLQKEALKAHGGDAGETPGPGLKVGGQRGDGQGAYTARYVKGKGNVLVCPPRATTEVDQVKDKSGRITKSKLKIQDPRALFGLPGAKPGTVPGFQVIDKRKKKRKKG